MPPLSETPAERSSFVVAGSSNPMAAIGAAVGDGVQEIVLSLSCADGKILADGVPFEKVLAKFSCHVIMKLLLEGEWSAEMRAALDDLVFIYDAQDHVYVTKSNF